MILSLTRTTTGSWLLCAYELNDSENWSRFVPSPANSQPDRNQFVKSVELACTETVKMHPRKEMHIRGRCVFEYNWEMSEDTILNHAMAVAADLNLELQIGELPVSSTIPRSVA